MTEQTAIQTLNDFLMGRKDKFITFNEGGINKLNFAAECDFARQALSKNEYMMNVARNNQQSLADAICNVAAIGITLNPAEKLAYLIPRKVGYDSNTRKDIYAICLDLSYMGLIKLATDTNVVKYMKCELIHENDEFEYLGFDRRPIIKLNPFSKDRGEVVGGIAWAKTNNGEYLCETMTIDQINQIRDKSESYKSAVAKGESSWQYKNCVWIDPVSKGEMEKKTVIKRLYKTLPKSGGNTQVMSEAIDMLNQHEGIDFDSKPRDIEYTDKQSQAYLEALNNSDYTGLISLRENLSIEANNALCDLHEIPLVEKGKKGKYFAQMDENFKVARTLRDDNLQALIELIDSGDHEGVEQLLSECNEYERDWYLRKLNGEQQMIVNQTQAA